MSFLFCSMPLSSVTISGGKLIQMPYCDCDRDSF